jgi:hypothetical protein
LQRMQYIMLLVWQITYLKELRTTVNYLTSEHDNLFQSFISTIKDDLLTHKKIFTSTQLLKLFFRMFALWSKGKLHITQTFFLRATGKISLLLLTVLPSWNKDITYLLTYLLDYNRN